MNCPLQLPQAGLTQNRQQKTRNSVGEWTPVLSPGRGAGGDWQLASGLELTAGAVAAPAQRMPPLSIQPSPIAADTLDSGVR